MRETQNFGFEIKSIEPDGTFTGYAGVFNNIDHGGDKILPGAFAKSLMEHRGVVPILADHNSRTQIGWNVSAREDGFGLLVNGKLDLSIQAAKDKHSLAKTAQELGAKQGLSIGYEATKRRWEGDVRILEEVKLYEYSFVTFPMNDLASVSAIKSAIEPLLREGKVDVRSFEKILREVGFSKSRAKAVASFAFSNRCDADDEKRHDDILALIANAKKALV